MLTFDSDGNELHGVVELVSGLTSILSAIIHRQLTNHQLGVGDAEEFHERRAVVGLDDLVILEPDDGRGGVAEHVTFDGHVVALD